MGFSLIRGQSLSWVAVVLLLDGVIIYRCVTGLSDFVDLVHELSLLIIFVLFVNWSSHIEVLLQIRGSR